MFSEGQGLKAFFRGAFYVFIAIFPFVLYEGFLFNGTATRMINTVLFVEILAIIFGGALFFRKRRLSFGLSPVTASLTFLLLILFISSVLGVDFNASFWSKATRTTGLFYFLHLALLYLFFWFAFDQEKPLRTFLKILAISTGVFALASIFGQEGLKWFFESKPWSGLTIGNSTFAGMYLYAGFMVTIYLLATTNNNAWWKKLFPLVFLFNPYMFNFDVFRGAVDFLHHPATIIGSAQASSITLYFSAIVLLAFWLGGRITKPAVRRTVLLVMTAIGILVFSMGVNSLLREGGKMQQIYLTQASATRPIVWKFSQKAINEHPVFGWGVDNFDRIFQAYYDPRILELKNGGEAWLDRAHNIFVDQTIESGYVGMGAYLLVYIVLLAALLYVIIRSKVRNDVVLAVVLLVYFVGHMLEIQTAFDTTITYLLLTCFSAIVGMLYMHTRTAETKHTSMYELPFWGQIIVGSALIIFAVGIFSIGTVPILKAESANGAIRRVGSSDKRLQLYGALFASPLDEGAFLWRTSNDLQRGVSLNPKVLDDSKQREGLKRELEVVVVNYEQYLQKYPNDYRAILNLADMYIYLRLFEVNDLDKAQNVLDHAVTLVPQSPQPYWMKAVAYLYQAKFKEAREWAKKAYDLNPNIEESTRVMEYINKSIKDFPAIDLYSFKQI